MNVEFPKELLQNRMPNIHTDYFFWFLIFFLFFRTLWYFISAGGRWEVSLSEMGVRWVMMMLCRQYSKGKIQHLPVSVLHGIFLDWSPILTSCWDWLMSQWVYEYWLQKLSSHWPNHWVVLLALLIKNCFYWSISNSVHRFLIKIVKREKQIVTTQLFSETWCDYISTEK